MDPAMNDNRNGMLVLSSLPSRETEELVVSYLSRIIKNASADRLANKVKATPFVLSKNIPVEKGQKIARNLRELGAKAEFFPHVPIEPKATIPPGTRSIQLPESPHLLPARKKSRQSRPQTPPGRGKQLITAFSSIILIAALSLLAWQVYRIIAEKFSGS